MFDRLRKALFSRSSPPAAAPAPAASSHAAIAAWCAAQGYALDDRGGRGYIVQGETQGLRWQLEQGLPTRNFIRGGELRARTELGLHQDVAVLVLNRQLKEGLENRAFAEFTDSLRTVADATLPEEMRWLSMYDEVILPDAPIGFHDLFAVLADESQHARAWLDPALASELMRWPSSVNEQTPVLLMTLRGNVYLRMESSGRDLAVLEQACRLYPTAAQRAREVLPRAAGAR